MIEIILRRKLRIQFTIQFDYWEPFNALTQRKHFSKNEAKHELFLYQCSFRYSKHLYHFNYYIMGIKIIVNHLLLITKRSGNCLQIHNDMLNLQ